MGLLAARVDARNGRVCTFVCANVHAPFFRKAPYARIILFLCLFFVSLGHQRVPQEPLQATPAQE